MSNPQRDRSLRPWQTEPPAECGLAGRGSGKQTKAGAVLNEGDGLRPKFAAVKLLSQPSEQSDAVTTLARGDEVIFLGKEQDGFLNVESAKGGGWVKKVLVGR